MEQIEWDEKFNIGVEVVDKAHAKLFRILKKLLDVSPDTDINQATYKEGIKYLETYSMTHFMEEEAYMRSIRYSGYAQHKKIHDTFRDKTLVSLKKDLETAGYSHASIQRFTLTMNNWLTEHIMKEDQAIVGRTISRKGFDLSSQIPIISRAVNRASTEVFQTEAKLASEDYKGQNIGSSYYCYQNYDIDGGIRLQILLGVEEALVLRGGSLILGRKTAQKGQLDIEDLLHIFTPLFQNVSKIFRVQTEYELNKEHLLTRDMFRQFFMKGGYPCRLLFSTKLGYFIFCYRNWQIKSQSTAKTT